MTQTKKHFSSASEVGGEGKTAQKRRQQHAENADSFFFYYILYEYCTNENGNWAK